MRDVTVSLCPSKMGFAVQASGEGAYLRRSHVDKSPKVHLQQECS